MPDQLAASGIDIKYTIFSVSGLNCFEQLMRVPNVTELMLFSLCR